MVRGEGYGRQTQYDNDQARHGNARPYGGGGGNEYGGLGYQEQSGYDERRSGHVGGENQSYYGEREHSYGGGEVRGGRGESELYGRRGPSYPLSPPQPPSGYQQQVDYGRGSSTGGQGEYGRGSGYGEEGGYQPQESDDTFGAEG